MAEKHKARRQTDKLLAEWFWTDRWRGSQAFSLPMEARGLYREMLTAAWSQGAKLPNDPQAIRRLTGCNEKEWKRCWPKVSHFWTVDGDWLVNVNQVVIYLEAKEAQARAQARAQAAAQASANARRKDDLMVSLEHALESSPPVSGLRSLSRI